MDEIIGIAKVTAKMQITVPKSVRKVLKIKPGDRVLFISEGDRIVLRKAKIIPV